MNYNQILDCLDLEIIVINPKTYEIKYANQKYLDKHGIKELGLKKCYEISHKKSEPCKSTEHPCPLNKTLRNKKKSSFLHKHFDLHGDQYMVEVSTIPILSLDGNVDLVVEKVEDVSERQEQLQLMEQRAAVGIMASAVAHEMNNQLTGYKGSFQLLLKKAGYEDHNANIGALTRSVENLERLVKNLSNLGKPLNKEMQLVALDCIIREMIDELVLEGILKYVEIKYHFESKTPNIYIMPNYIKQVILNLCINSVHAMEGSIEKRLTICCGLQPDGEFIYFSISDTGCGIPNDRLNKIFEPFYTTKEEKGTGLGLWVIKSIIENHGGSVTVESVVGLSTTFKLYLPLNMQA